MSKHNLLFKKLKKQILSINDLIESNFNRLKYFKSNYKKIILNKENRVFLGSAIAVILTLSYFLIPTFYDKEKIRNQIENQILKNYNIQIKFKKPLTYGLLPKPHFNTKELSIIYNGKEIAVVNNFKTLISIQDFLSINKLKLKDLIFDKADFNIYKDDVSFFVNLLKTQPNENKIIIKDSNIFFKSEDENVLFINKINNIKFYYDSNNLLNIFSSQNEIFNIPFRLEIENDKFNKKIYSKFNSQKIRLTLENEIDYDNIENKSGILDILLINKSSTLTYNLKKNLLNFSSQGKKNDYNGKIEFKPFYLSSKLKYEGVSTKNFFKDDSIFIDLIKAEILNNKNLNANVNVNIKNITNIDELNNLILNIEIEEGDISLSGSNIMWKDDVNIKLNQSLLNYNDEEVSLNGSLFFEFKDVQNFYQSFQIPKNSRKDISFIEIDFVYNINQRKINFYNPKINKKINKNLDKFINNYNYVETKIFNKVRFKNFVNDFFKSYDG